jgi:hypothetical protein
MGCRGVLPCSIRFRLSSNLRSVPGCVKSSLASTDVVVVSDYAKNPPRKVM